MADDRRFEKGGHIPGTPTIDQLFGQQDYPDLNTGALNFGNKLEVEVASLYEEMLDLDAKLSGKNSYDKSLVTEFKSRIKKIGEKNLRDLHSMLSGSVENKRIEYKEKVEREQNEAFHSLLNDFFGITIGKDNRFQYSEEAGYTRR